MNMQIVRTAMQCTFTLTRMGKCLRMDRYEPHSFRQFGTEQCIITVQSYSRRCLSVAVGGQKLSLFQLAQ